MPRSAVETPQQLNWTSCSGQLADSDRSPAAIQWRSKRASLKEQISAQRHCKTCRTPLHADDTHAECVSYLGKSCSHCESFSLASLRSWIAFFSERDRDLWGKNSGAEVSSGRWQASSRRLNARVPRRHRRESFHPSSSLNMISIPLRLQTTWSRLVRVMAKLMTAFLWRLRTSSVTDPALLPSSSSHNARLRADDKGCQWARARTVSILRSQSWRAPYSSRIRPSAFAALT